MSRISSAAVSALAPKGTLHVGINLGNFLLTATDPKSGEYTGIAVDLGRELARRLGVPAEIIAYPSPAALADAAGSGKWDVGFLGAEPQRAREIDFTAAYVEIEATYLVPPDSPIRSIAEVDHPGARIAVSAKSAYDLYLSRHLKHAELVRATGADNVFRRFVDDKLTALASLRPRLLTDQANLPGSRILDGQFTAVQQAAGTPKGRDAAGAAALRAFIEDAKARGLVAQLIEKNNVRGLTVAPKA
jgi:polar amino acid transport system substrate-binding protein